MNENDHVKHRKVWVIAVIALILAVYSFSVVSVLTLGGNVTNNYTNITGGSGGVSSFNGSAVDLNNSMLYNGSNINISSITYRANSTMNLTVRYYINHTIVWSEE